MATEKFLFVGGCADGQLLEVRQGLINTMRIATVTEIPKFIRTADIPCEDYSKRGVWLGDPKGVNQSKIEIFALDTMSEFQVLQRLISGYDPRPSLVKACERAEDAAR